MAVNKQKIKKYRICGDSFSLSSGREKAIKENTYVVVIVFSLDMYLNNFACGVNRAHLKGRKLNTDYIKK